MNDEHSVGLTDPRIIQILNQSKEGRAKLQGWKEREASTNDPPPIQTNTPALSLRNIINALVFSVIIAGLLTLLMIGIIEVVRWIFDDKPERIGLFYLQEITKMHATPRILDPCSGSRMMWFDRQSSDVIFGDIRKEEHTLCDGRLLKINPDVLMDFRNLPYTDNSFHLIAFDPPHLIYAGQKSWLALKYGKLEQDWREDLKQGFSECFRVLKENGVLCFKWNETQIKVREVLELTPIKPLFGNTSGKKAGTHWYVFMKPEE